MGASPTERSANVAEGRYTTGEQPVASSDGASVHEVMATSGAATDSLKGGHRRESPQVAVAAEHEKRIQGARETAMSWPNLEPRSFIPAPSPPPPPLRTAPVEPALFYSTTVTAATDPHPFITAWQEKSAKRWQEKIAVNPSLMSLLSKTTP